MEHVINMVHCETVRLVQEIYHSGNVIFSLFDF